MLGPGKNGPIITHSASVTSLEYRGDARSCSFRVNSVQAILISVQLPAKQNNNLTNSLNSSLIGLSGQAIAKGVGNRGQNRIRMGIGQPVTGAVNHILTHIPAPFREITHGGPRDNRVGAAPNRQNRIEGLTDEYRPGRPRTVSDAQVAEVIERTLQTTPKDATHWSIRSMAAEAGLSHTTIRRI